MTNDRIGQTVIVYKDEFAYISHPSIAVLSEGQLIAVFNHSIRRSKWLHPPSDPLFRNMLSHSIDGGASWQPPYCVPDFNWSGVECPGVTVLQDDSVMLSQYRISWYPLVLARKRRAQGELISICLPQQGWTEDFDDQDWGRSQYPWAKGCSGLYVHISCDGGRSFDHTVKIDTAPYRVGYTRTGVIQLSDGRVAYAVTEHHPPYSRHTYVLFSDDGGRAWNRPVLICARDARDLGEPDIVEVAPGEICCVLRSNKPGDFLHMCRSVDAGQTWSEPQPTPLVGHPGHLLVLQDGRLLCTYGYRHPPFGIRACLCDDGARTWNLDREIVIRNDMPNSDLGYPTTIEYEPGRLFCCYYGQTPEGITCVQGTHFDLA